jgi:hypothetical protein
MPKPMPPTPDQVRRSDRDRYLTALFRHPIGPRALI